MRLLVLVLNHEDKLEDLLAEFLKIGISGATVLSSTGMARVLTGLNEEDIPLFGSIRALLNPEREQNHTILTVIRNEQLAVAVEAIESVIGDLSEKDSGIVFSMPVDFVRGISTIE